MIQQTTMAAIAVAALAAAAAMCVWAAGYALYAWSEPSFGPAAAAALVSMAAAFLLLVAVIATRRSVAGHKQIERVKEEDPAPSPVGMALTFAKERPIVALGATVLVGILASKQPRLVGELANLLNSASDHHRRS